MEEQVNPEKPQVDPSVITELKRITAKNVDEVTEDEAKFLRARKFYVGKNSRQKFAEIFAQKDDHVVEGEKAKDPNKDEEKGKKTEGKQEKAKEEKKGEFPDVNDSEASRGADNDDLDDDSDDEDEDESDKA